MTLPFSIKGKRVFVAGHRGMLGQAICAKVKENGGTVVSVPRSDLDLRDRTATADWIKNAAPDAIIMAAARVGGVADNIASQGEMCADNIAIALSTIDGAHRAGVQRFLYVASSAVYPHAAPQPLNEKDIENGAPDPTHDGYAAAKHAGIALCRTYHDQYGRDYFAALPTNLFGPSNASGERAHVIPALLQRFHNERESGATDIAVWGTGTPKRDFLHVDDCSDALICILENQTGFATVNVGSGIEMTIRELAVSIAKITGFTGTLSFDSSRPDGAPRRALNIGVLQDMGWSGPNDFQTQLAAVYAAVTASKEPT